MSTLVRRLPGAERGLMPGTRLLDINAELGTATVSVDLGEATNATVPVVSAAMLASNAVMGRVFAERLLGLDTSATGNDLDLAFPSSDSLMVRASLITEPRRLLDELQCSGVGTIAVDIAVFDDRFDECARWRMEWTVRHRRSADWPVGSP